MFEVYYCDRHQGALLVYVASTREELAHFPDSLHGRPRMVIEIPDIAPCPECRSKAKYVVEASTGIVNIQCTSCETRTWSFLESRPACIEWQAGRHLYNSEHPCPCKGEPIKWEVFKETVHTKFTSTAVIVASLMMLLCVFGIALAKTDVVSSLLYALMGFSVFAVIVFIGAMCDYRKKVVDDWWTRRSIADSKASREV